MAGQSKSNKNGNTPSTEGGFLSKFVPIIDGLVFVAILLGLGFYFWANPGARQSVWEALGYGLIPASLFAAAFLVCLRYHTRLVFAHWRIWVCWLALAVISIGILSLFHASGGTLSYASLGGNWGQLVGGNPRWLAVLKMGAVCVLLPPLLYPRRIGSAYLIFLRNLGLGLRHAFTFACTAVAAAISACARGWRLVKRSAADASGANDAREDDLADSATGGSRAVSTFWAQAGQDDIPDEPSLDEAEDTTPLRQVKSQWSLPSMDCLAPPEPHEQSQAPLEEMARHVEESLAEHGVHVEVKDIKAGPRIVQFGLVPGWVGRKSAGGQSSDDDAGDGQQGTRARVKVQSILSREKDLALALQTPYLRIEAPVPGEALVGIEVPSPTPSKVHLREIMESPPFVKIMSKGGLPVALGQDTGGAPVAMDLVSLPHLLIAGATGSGKSVCINSIVASLLLTKPPDQLRMLMVDPKRVELTPFNKIPHLVAPVIVDADEVTSALRAMLREMNRRYKQLEEHGTRNISGYNSKSPEPMPYLVIIVDELADLMIAGGFEVEQSLVRLAQLGRAAGIHLVLATQRPSVQVVTGLLKANIPSRVAFAVASQVDSRVILDVVGAEKLMGKGDAMLLNSDSPKPRRVQGALVYDEEVEEMVRFWREQKGPPLEEISMGDDEVEDEGEELGIEDRIMEQARDVALRNPHISSGYMTRRFKIGEQRANQIMEALEEEGLVIPSAR